MIYSSYYDSPLGRIILAAEEEGLIGLWFEGQKHFNDHLLTSSKLCDTSVLDYTKKWLDLYFVGQEPDFTPPLKMICSPFRKEVCRIMMTIPFGKTMTYGEIALIIAGKRGGARMSAQAVGGAVGHNDISLIIPCHRVIGAAGKLTGYAGGLDKKEWLLRHEGALR